MSDYAILVTTIDNLDAARALAKAALAARLAACVQIFPIESHYVWQDEARACSEYFIQMKLRAKDYPALAELVRSRHSYEVPEILQLPVAAGDAAYLGWIDAAVRR